MTVTRCHCDSRRKRDFNWKEICKLWAPHACTTIPPRTHLNGNRLHFINILIAAGLIMDLYVTITSYVCFDIFASFCRFCWSIMNFISFIGFLFLLLNRLMTHRRNQEEKQTVWHRVAYVKCLTCTSATIVVVFLSSSLALASALLLSTRDKCRCPLPLWIVLVMWSLVSESMRCNDSR